MDEEMVSIFSRFFGGAPVSARMIDTSRGDSDFRVPEKNMC